MREKGYYWVKFKDGTEWDVAHFVDGLWFFPGYDPECPEKEVIEAYEIGEKVERKEKQ